MSKYTDKQLKDLIRQAGDQFSLSASHKTAIRFHLMDVIKSGEARTSMQHTRNIFSPRRFAMPLVPIIIALVLAIGGGTATFANTAKPGDALYPVDQLIEQIQEKLTSSPEAKTELLAKFADERVQELGELNDLDSTKLTETAKQLWESHRQEAIDRVTISIARVTANQEKFEERLATEADSAKQAVLQKIVAQLDEVMAKRATKLNDLQAKTFPGLPQLNLKLELEESQVAHQQEIEQIREQAKQLWGNTTASNKASDGSPDGSVSTPTSSNQTGSTGNSSDNQSGAGSQPSSGSASNQVTVDIKIPIDDDSWLPRVDLIDTDKDGIPDDWDKEPDWGPHTMGA